jgi:aminocarboxymuconate-semialdehyde decarboxylase
MRTNTVSMPEGDEQHLSPSGIDVHGHGVPRAFLESQRRSRRQRVQIELDDGTGGYVVTFPGRPPLRPISRQMLDFTERLGWLDDQGLQRQHVAPWLDVDGQELEAASGQVWVRELNDHMAHVAAASSNRLMAHATLHLADAGAAAKELERCHRDLGMRGCMIPTHVPQGELTDPPYDGLWECAQALRIPIVLHPPTTGPSSRMEGIREFGGLFGRLIDTTTVATQLLVSGVFDRFPRLLIILVHGGGFLPYQSGRLDREQAGRPNQWGVQGRLSDYVRRYYFDTVLMSASSIRFLVQFAGDDRVMLGSDYPFTADAPRIARAVQDAGLGATAAAAVDRGTARRLFGGEMDVEP